jgi:hypothetical protein
MADCMGEKMLAALGAPDSHQMPYGAAGLNGLPGIAMACAALATSRNDERYATAMHDALRRATGAFSPHFGANGGVGGLRAAACYAQNVVPSYARLIARCDELSDRFSDAPVPEKAALSNYDVISGWAGARLARGPSSSDWLVERLLWLMSDDSRWYCANPQAPEGVGSNLLGIAHGIAGALAALSLTTEYDETNHAVAVSIARRVAAAWDDRNGRWPYSFQNDRDDLPGFAWCYGSAAIAAVLRSVGTWAHDADLLAISDRALITLLASDTNEPKNDQALCHGRIGAALICASVAANGGPQELHLAAHALTERALTQLAADRAICRSISLTNGEYEAYGFLDGSAGIILTLCTLFDRIDASWMYMHALQPVR